MGTTHFSFYLSLILPLRLVGAIPFKALAMDLTPVK
jgi:hypothetical protein